ncbi:helix-turn-helix domain-containing protein [Streptococcus iniae]|uniref:helix-turn-helix domain-containing protein n=1 Tax=Streptococcus gallolyticus TaxID=315405 RepID=UPI0008D96D1C|nr:helix-turn-helix transcriptional regulator [Streptococcus gallolyticus]OHX26269.1 DNA-binding protein [Streptococcus iniae]WAW99131.1 helix-turn-helix transcriptional regulator [Streptococcus gallolyticus]
MALNNITLKRLRKEKKLTQTELATKLNISQKSYSNWESGKSEPTLDNIVKLAQILDTTTDELLDRHMDFGDRVFDFSSNYNLSNIKNFTEQELYDLKTTITIALFDNSINILAIKDSLITKYNLDSDERLILNTAFKEAKETYDEMIKFEKLRRERRKIKWPLFGNKKNK